MKQISLIFIIFLFLLSINKTYAEDALTIKQQLDRIMEEVKDLNKAVFNKSFDKDQIFLKEESNETERFTSIDIRIYDLEKDIKSLTLQFEEIIFKLDDISNDMISLESELISKIDSVKFKLETESFDSDKSGISEETLIKEENTLGKIVISNNDKSISNEKLSNTEPEIEKNDLEKELAGLTPEAQMQYALDQILMKDYDKSKEILEKFILNFSENQLSGSAHFWLGKIYLFETNYRKAAIVFGEGVQKFPKSIKAAEMYYELAKSLKEMNKIPESCKTLNLLEENYKSSKFSKDPDKIKDSLNCVANN